MLSSQITALISIRKIEKMNIIMIIMYCIGKVLCHDPKIETEWHHCTVYHRFYIDFTYNIPHVLKEWWALSINKCL